MPIDDALRERPPAVRTRWSKARWPIAVVALFAVLAAVAAPSAAEPATPAAASISVNPATDLVQGDDVTVTGSGFPGNRGLAFVQCVPGTGMESCNLSNIQYVTTSPSGNFSFVFTPRRVLRVAGVTYDCAVDQCRIGGGTLPDGAEASAVADIAFDPSVPLPPPPAVTVTPSTDLLEGQTVTVEGTAFEPNAGVGIVQCATPPSESGSNCNVPGVKFITVDPDGTFSATFVVHRMLYNGGVTDCSVAGACVIGVGNGDPTAGDTADIRFDPSVPPPPPPTLTATPSVDLANGQTVTVRGQGYPASTTLGMAQCLTSEPTSAGCDLSNYKFVTTDNTGSFTTTFTVRSTYTSSQMGFVDCLTAPDHCRIGAGTAENGLGADALLTFSTAAPTTPPTPPSEVESANAVAVTPNFTG